MSNLLDIIRDNKEIIMSACGVVAAIAGIVKIKKSKLKCKEILDTHKENISVIEEVFEIASEEEYNETDRENDLNINNVQTIKSLTKLYIAPIFLILSGIYTTINGVLKINKRRIQNEQLC